MKNVMENGMVSYLEGKIALHKANYLTFVNNMTGVAEHGDYAETLLKELEEIAKYRELLEALRYIQEEAPVYIT